MKRQTTPFALCLDNVGNEASLILGYLFDKSQFAIVDFPQAVRKKILALQKAS